MSILHAQHVSLWICPISRAQQPHVAHGYYLGQCSSRVRPQRPCLVRRQIRFSPNNPCLAVHISDLWCLHRLYFCVLIYLVAHFIPSLSGTFFFFHSYLKVSLKTYFLTLCLSLSVSSHLDDAQSTFSWRLRSQGLTPSSQTAVLGCPISIHILHTKMSLSSFISHSHIHFLLKCPIIASPPNSQACHVAVENPFPWVLYNVMALSSFAQLDQKDKRSWWVILCSPMTDCSSYIYPTYWLWSTSESACLKRKGELFCGLSGLPDLTFGDHAGLGCVVWVLGLHTPDPLSWLMMVRGLLGQGPWPLVLKIGLLRGGGAGMVK